MNFCNGYFNSFYEGYILSSSKRSQTSNSTIMLCGLVRIEAYIWMRVLLMAYLSLEFAAAPKL
jgi:hypothetical protein